MLLVIVCEYKGERVLGAPHTYYDEVPATYPLEINGYDAICLYGFSYSHTNSVRQ